MDFGIIILAIIQGIAEFLPISSSAHLILFRDLFGIGSSITADMELIFDIALHLGTLLAIFIFFFKDFWKMIVSFFTKGTKEKEGRLCLYLIIATIPAALAGVFLEDIIDGMIRSNFILIACALIFMGIVISNSLIGIIQECKVKSLIDKLSVITATKARKLTADGTITEIPIESLAVSDTIHIMTGDQIVADGEVLTSDGLEVNESHLTGESVPVFKKPGDFLYSGSFIVAGSGTAKVLKSVEDSYAAELTKKAQTKRRATSEMQDAIKRIIRYVSFAIVPIGAALFCIQYFRANDTLSNALVSTVAGVLGMIPEGLVLLTSVSFILGVGRLARKKALVQEMEAIEALARVDVLLSLIHI